MVQRAWQTLFGEPLLHDKPKLIVPLDGSAFAESVLEAAAGLTADLNGKLILVRVEDSPADVQTALEYLTRMQVQLAVQHPNLVIETDLRVAEAAVGIAEAIAKQEAALVVMARHARGGALRTILGNVAGKVIQQAEVPVVLMRPTPVEPFQPALAGVATA
jgi:nucleotide-binding universal stress UspA family protein